MKNLKDLFTKEKIEKLKAILNFNPETEVKKKIVENSEIGKFLASLNENTQIPNEQIPAIRQHLTKLLISSDEFLILINKNSMIVSCTPPHLKENKYFIHKFCKKFGFSDLIQCMGLELLTKKENKDFIRALSNIDYGILEAFHNFKEDGPHTKKEDWQKANQSLKDTFKEKYTSFQKACLPFLSNENFALSAVTNDPTGIAYLDSNLRKNPDIILAAIEGAYLKGIKPIALGKIITSIDEELKNDKVFAEKMVAFNPAVLRCFNEKLKNDLDLNEIADKSQKGEHDFENLAFLKLSSALEKCVKIKEKEVSTIKITLKQYLALDADDLNNVYSAINIKKARVYISGDAETEDRKYIKLTNHQKNAAKEIILNLIKTSETKNSVLKEIKEEIKSHRPPTMEVIHKKLTQYTGKEDLELCQKISGLLKIYMTLSPSMQGMKHLGILGGKKQAPLEKLTPTESKTFEKKF